MKRNLFKVASLSLLCAWAGYAGPWQSAMTPPALVRPEQEVMIEGCGDAPEGPELAVTPPHALETAWEANHWGMAALQPNFAARFQRPERTVSPLSCLLAVLVPQVALAASPPPVGGMPNYPVQPALRVSWSLQGMADDMDEGGEGADVTEYEPGG